MKSDNRYLISCISRKPELYAESSHAFWDDEHISKYMLEAHLAPDYDAASRNRSFMVSSADWLAKHIGASAGSRLLDLGCGPGLYAELLTDRGFCVTGVDMSTRSIAHAADSAKKSGRQITYRCMNYLDIDYGDEFDAAILIYCDFGVLSPKDRHALLLKIRRALKPGGVIILDAHSLVYKDSFTEKESYEYNNGGFWSSKPHALIERNIFYEETANVLDQYIVMTNDATECYNIWNQLYTKESLRDEFIAAGFSTMEFFDDVAGAKFTGEADTLCIAARK